jgi:glycosyltransferase involved in cell wall biosynthesis
VLKQGNYDIIHSHHDYLSGFYLIATLGIRFRRRILHIHNTDKHLPVGNVHLQNLLLRPFRALAIFFTDLVLGISKDSLNSFKDNYGGEIPKFELLYYGINLSIEKVDVNREEFLSQIDIPLNAKVLIFVGRLYPLKNPMFALQIMAEIAEHTDDIYLLVIGKGELEEEMKKYLFSHNLNSNVRMLGWQENVLSLMRICDLFIFPRIEFPKEGLGFTVLEAQLAGLPVLISKGIVEETFVIKDQVHVLGIDEGVNVWKDKVMELLTENNKIEIKTAKKYFADSVFNLEKSVSDMLSYYS